MTGESLAAQTFGVSRGAYPEAVRSLAAKGLVESRPKAGTRVLPQKQWNILDYDILLWTFTDTPHPQIAKSIIELWHIIEPSAASLSAKRRYPAHLEQIKYAADVLRKYAIDSPNGRNAQKMFHQSLISFSMNNAMIAFTNMIFITNYWAIKYCHTLSDPPHGLPDAYCNVCSAIASGDADAAAALTGFLIRCLIPRFDGAILSLEWKEAAWDKFVTGALRPGTLSEQQYSDRKLRSRR